MSFSLTGAIRAFWWLLLAWQAVWHALLPVPLGSANWLLAVLAVLPLAAVSPLVARGGRSGNLYGGMAVLIYFMIGVMEAWSNPPQRFAALVQTGLCVTWMALLFRFSRLQAQD